MDCRLEVEVSKFWTGGGSQLIMDWRRESVDCGLGWESVYCGLEDKVRGLWTGGGSQWTVDLRMESVDIFDWRREGQGCVAWRRESVDCELEMRVKGLWN